MPHPQPQHLATQPLDQLLDQDTTCQLPHVPQDAVPQLDQLVPPDALHHQCQPVCHHALHKDAADQPQGQSLLSAWELHTSEWEPLHPPASHLALHHAAWAKSTKQIITKSTGLELINSALQNILTATQLNPAVVMTITSLIIITAEPGPNSSLCFEFDDF